MTLSLQDRRRRYIASEIAAAAMTLFGEHGFDDVTVEEIAAAAGISSRTFFRYYATKEEVILQYQRRLNERLVEALAGRPPEEGPVTALREAYLATSRVAPEDCETVVERNRFLAGSRALRVRADGERAADSKAVTDVLAERIGADPADPRLETVAVAMGATASAAFTRWVAAGGIGDPADEIGGALALIERGLAALDKWPKGATAQGLTKRPTKASARSATSRQP
jgi:AcrR family transcriptional regulator